MKKTTQGMVRRTGGRDTTYTLDLGDGADNIIDLGGMDTLAFGPANDARYENERKVA